MKFHLNGVIVPLKHHRTSILRNHKVKLRTYRGERNGTKILFDVLDAMMYDLEP